MRAENTSRDLRELAGMFDFDERLVLDRNLDVLLKESRSISPLLLPRQYYSALPANQKNVHPRLPPRNCYLTLRIKPHGAVQDKGKKDYPDKFCSYFTEDVTLGRYLFFAMTFPDKALIAHQSGDLRFNSDGISLRIAEKNNSAEWRLVFTPPRTFQQQPAFEITTFQQTSSKSIERDKRIEGWAFLKRQADGTQTVNVLGRIDYRAVNPDVDLDGTWPPEGFRDIKISVGRRDSTDKSVKPIDLEYEDTGFSDLSLSGNSTSIYRGQAQLELIRTSNEDKLTTTSFVEPPFEWEAAQRGQDRVSAFLGDWFFPKDPEYFRHAIADTDLILRATQKTQVLEKAIWQTSLALFVLLILITVLLFFGFKRYVRPLWMMSRTIRLHEEQNAPPAALNQVATTKPNIAEGLLSLLDICLSWLISRVVVPIFEDKKIVTGVRFPYANQSDEVGLFARRCNALLDESDRQKKEITEAATALHEQADATAKAAASRAETLKLIRHEIKNDLQYLQQEDLPSEKRVNLVQRIKFIFSALEDATSPEHVKYTLAPYDLQSYLETVAINASQSGTRVTLQVHNESEGSFLSMVDLWLMEGVVGNILSNAREHGLDSQPIRIFLAREESVASIRILNDGPTIPDHIIGSIFNRFFSYGERKTDASHGVGLWIAETYVKKMHGEIMVRNHASGVEFEIHLPLCEAEITQVATDESTAASQQFEPGGLPSSLPEPLTE